MQDPAMENERVLHDFARRHARQKIATAPFIAVLAIGAILWVLRKVGIVTGPHPLLGWTLFGVVLILGLFAAWNWRCPACGGYLGRKLSPRTCVHCGAALRRPRQP